VLLLKRIGLSLGTAVIAYVGTFIIWYVMTILAYIPILGSIYALVIWATELWWGWIGHFIGLSAVGMLAILAALSMGLETWEKTASPRDWRPNYPPTPVPEPMDDAALIERMRRRRQERSVPPQPLPLSDADDDLPDFLKRK
jgi:hypothetical protein